MRKRSKKPASGLPIERYVTGPLLQGTAGVVLPLYRAIARNASFAAKWAWAVRKADLTRMDGLIRKATGIRQPLLGANGIGFFWDFNVPDPIMNYANGTYIMPGQVRFFFETTAIRSIAKALVPLYEKLAYNSQFAAGVAKAVRAGDERMITRFIRSQVRTSRLKSVRLESSGFNLVFADPRWKYEYHNAFFRDVPEDD